MKGDTLMKDSNDNRVLGRRGARLVTEIETDVINGGVRTETFCSIGPKGPDGDQFTGDCAAT
jgi:hypothetical protein